MSIDLIDLERFGERLALLRRTYGETIDLPNLGSAVFASLLGISAIAYSSYERGERESKVDFLVALRKKTGVCLVRHRP